MKIVEKICKEWNSICRVFNIKENPLTYSHKDLLEFAEYYHKSQLNNDVALDIVSNCCPKCKTINITDNEGVIWCYECEKAYDC